MGDNDGPFPWVLVGIWLLALLVLAVTGWSVWLMVT